MREHRQATLVGRILEIVYVAVLAVLAMIMLLNLRILSADGGWFPIVLSSSFILFVAALVLIALLKKAAHAVHIVLSIYYYFMLVFMNFLALFLILYTTAIALFPPVVVSRGEAHKVMPMGQIVVAFMISAILTMVAVILYARSNNIMKAFHDRYCRRHGGKDRDFARQARPPKGMGPRH